MLSYKLFVRKEFCELLENGLNFAVMLSILMAYWGNYTPSVDSDTYLKNRVFHRLKYLPSIFTQYETSIQNMNS